MKNSSVLDFECYCDEAQKALKIIQSAISTLKSCDENTNFKEEIGKYAREMPNFNLLSSRDILSCIRRVCTGEIEPNKAIKILEEIEFHLTV